MKVIFACLILLHAIAHSPTKSQDTSAQECTTDASVIEALSRDASKFKAPRGITQVKMELWIQDFLSISDCDSDFGLDLYVSETWFDPSLNFEYLNPCKANIAMNYEFHERMWTPRVAFVNSKEVSVHESPFKNIFVLVYANGTVWTTSRVRVRAPCKQNLSKFPMDTQNCSLIFESYRYSKDVIHLQWNDVPAPVMMLEEAGITDFILQAVNNQSTTPTYPAGTFDQLTAVFTFRRKLGYYVLQVYIPSFFLMIVSWVSFALGKSTAARSVLGTVPLLLMLLIYFNITRTLPRLSYITPFDIWILACISLIVLSLIELAIVEFLIRDTGDEKAANRIRAGAHYVGMNGTRPRAAVVADLMDKVSGFVFPTLFVVFNIVYWMCYA